VVKRDAGLGTPAKYKKEKKLEYSKRIYQFLFYAIKHE